MPVNECIYCQEESKYTVLIPKPSQFIQGNSITPLIDAGKSICLNCLEYEIGELKQM